MARLRYWENKKGSVVGEKSPQKLNYMTGRLAYQVRVSAKPCAMAGGLQYILRRRRYKTDGLLIMLLAAVLSYRSI